MTPKPPFAPVILGVDDEAGALQLLERIFRADACEFVAAPGGAAALEVLRRREVDLVISDLDMPGMSGIDLLEHIRREDWDVDVMIVTGHATVQNAVECMRRSTLDFVEKPYDPGELRRRAREILKRRLLRREHGEMRAARDSAGPQLIGASKPMQDLRDLARRVAPAEEVVLILGESGTGKELVARAIHAQGPRAAEPFLAVDCTTLSASVVESELFGHVKGAFTGAEAGRTGLFQAAGRGTIFLDEIGDFPVELQPRLLRALQEREVRPVGSNKPEKFQARVLAATHRDLAALVKAGKFREDLFWRINVVELRIPPLRERREDVLELARHFVRKYDASREGARTIDAAAAKALEGHDWPGNVRELENTIRRMLVLYPDTMVVEGLAPSSATAPPAPAASMTDWEKTAIRSAIAASRGNMTQAARSLGVSKSTLYRKMKEYGLGEPTQS